MDPASVRQAAAWADCTLRRIPLNAGESRVRNYRLWYGDVLGVFYDVDEDNYRVRVISIGPPVGTDRRYNLPHVHSREMSWPNHSDFASSAAG